MGVYGVLILYTLRSILLYIIDILPGIDKETQTSVWNMVNKELYLLDENCVAKHTVELWLSVIWVL